MNLSRIFVLGCLIYLSKAELAVDVAVSVTNFWFLKWINFVPVVLHDGNNTVLTEQMQSKFFIWADYFSSLADKEATLKYLYKINKDPEYKTLDVSLKEKYETDLTYTPTIDLQDRCLYNDNFKVVNEEVNRKLKDFHVSLLITCDPKPATGDQNKKENELEVLKKVDVGEEINKSAKLII